MLITLLAVGCATANKPGPGAHGAHRSAGLEAAPIDEAAAARFAGLALACVHREYPNKVGHVLFGDDDVKPPRELTPAFFGCFDWHSAVHGHWLLVRLVRTFPEADFAGPARAALSRSLTEANIAGELTYLEGRAGFERPYGLAWLLQLAAELRQWDDEDARRWAAPLEPLEHLAAKRFVEWLPKLSHPIRSGEHSQTAFAMGLALDWARATNDAAVERLLESRARDFHDHDESCPVALEPSGHDFLSPCLAAADLMRRVLPPQQFAVWLTRALPGIPEDGATAWLRPAAPSDRRDGKIAHLDGLNLSRAWMLEGIASGLPKGDARPPALIAAAREHRDAGLSAVTGEHYAGGHWLGSFATYLTTRRGVATTP
jgi:hypothetical protein